MARTSVSLSVGRLTDVSAVELWPFTPWYLRFQASALRLSSSDRVRVPVERGFELLDDFALLVDARFERADALLIGAQALDHCLAGFELRAQGFELRLSLRSPCRPPRAPR